MATTWSIWSALSLMGPVHPALCRLSVCAWFSDDGGRYGVVVVPQARCQRFSRLVGKMAFYPAGYFSDSCTAYMGEFIMGWLQGIETHTYRHYSLYRDIYYSPHFYCQNQMVCEINNCNDNIFNTSFTSKNIIQQWCVLATGIDANLYWCWRF